MSEIKYRGKAIPSGAFTVRAKLFDAKDKTFSDEWLSFLTFYITIGGRDAILKYKDL